MAVILRYAHIHKKSPTLFEHYGDSCVRNFLRILVASLTLTVCIARSFCLKQFSNRPQVNTESSFTYIASHYIGIGLICISLLINVVLRTLIFREAKKLCHCKKKERPNTRKMFVQALAMSLITLGLLSIGILLMRTSKSQQKLLGPSPVSALKRNTSNIIVFMLIPSLVVGYKSSIRAHVVKVVKQIIISNARRILYLLESVGNVLGLLTCDILAYGMPIRIEPLLHPLTDGPQAPT